MKKLSRMPQSTVFSVAVTTALTVFSSNIVQASQTISSAITSQVNWTSGDVTITNSGSVSVSTTALSVGGSVGTLTNSGTINGSVVAIYNRSSGTIGTFTNSGTVNGNIINASSHNLTINGGTGSVFGILTRFGGGIGSNNIGTLTNTAANLTFGSGNQLLNDNINVGSSHTVTNSAATLQLNNLINITGNYIQSAGATLNIGIADGATATGDISTDSGYGRLVVSGSATIASSSNVTLKPLSSYAFAQGQRFIVVKANTSGTNYNADTLVYTATGYNGTVTGTSVIDGSNTELLLTLVAPPPPPPPDSTPSAPINLATAPDSGASLSGLFAYSGTETSLLNLFNAAAALGSTSGANHAGVQLSPSNATAGTTTVC